MRFVGEADCDLPGTLDKEKDVNPIPRDAWSVFLTTWIKHRPPLGGWSNLEVRK